MKTKHRNIASIEKTAVLMTHRKSMCRIIDNMQTMEISYTLYFAYVCWCSVTMNRKDSCSFWRYRRFNLRSIHIETVRLNIDKHRLQFIPKQRMGRSCKRIGRRDNFSCYTHSLQSGNQCNCSIGKQRQIFNAKIVTKARLQLFVKTPPIRQAPTFPDLL